MNFVMGGGAQVGIVVAQAHGAAAVPWYLAGGAPMPVAVYQPKGAASLPDSYINLADPGTYDAAPGTAPAFDTATGWTFNGSSQYLTTGIVPALTWTTIVRFSNAVAKAGWIFGAYQSSNNGSYAILCRFTDGNTYFYRGSQFLGASGAADSGTLALVDTVAYRNGLSVGAIANAGAAPSSITLVIGANNLVGTVRDFYQGKIQAIAIYNTTLSAAQVAAISAAMAAL